MLSTEEFASMLKVKSGTVRRGLCVDGHYMGVTPIKLPNGRLLWPDIKSEQLIDGEVVKPMTVGRPTDGRFKT